MAEVVASHRLVDPDLPAGLFHDVLHHYLAQMMSASNAAARVD